ncbi:glycerol kinase GlpK [Denitromonas ohlonensis]|uniref:Glycerol kinase n=2 Tax=Denitromonas TaxID=139331 RepID=A0A557R3Y6_9RHOO|nr:glycerol kinase GlpK [Denitromonas ohlonensis]TVO59858.1 glycerol kinase GlpK [Denitromonas ohlonensis]TVO72969.1 glycerol kinase GlpK [Denitromonas ohlonensis]
MDYILALDQGTTSSRAMLFDAKARVCALAQQEFAQQFPRPGWVEHDANEIWQTQLACARQALTEAGVSPGAVRGVGISNQRETTVLWSRASGQPVAPAIVWQDRRTAEVCDRLRAEGHADLIRARTGLELDAYFSATKLAWLLDTVPGARVRATAGELAFGTIDSWLVWNLTAGACHVTDASNAARTMLFDIHRQQWDDDLLALFDVPRAVLPTVVASSGVLGECAPAVLGAVMPIAGVAGDQQAATFGQACLAPGMAKNTYGTGCFLTLNTGRGPVESQHRLLTTIGWQRPEGTDYLLEGGVFMAGAVVQWLRDGLGLIRSAGDIEALAAQVPDSGEVVMVPAFAGLGAPHWDAYARGSLMGMTRGTTAAHIARAALEAVALQNVDLLTAMAADGAEVKELRVDGGMTRNNLLMQLQADLLGVPVLRPRQTETTALGAAFLAGRAVGVWPDDAALAAHWQLDRAFEPNASADRREALIARWHKAIERNRGWADGA